MTANFTVSIEDGVKALPVGTKRFTQADDGSVAYLLEGTNAADVTGEQIARGVPYILDVAVQYYIRSPRSTSVFGIVTGA